MIRNIIHITPRQIPNSLNWAVIKQNAERATKILENKIDAIKYGKPIAQESGFGQIVVHGKNGKIQYENTYGNDPKEYKG